MNALIEIALRRPIAVMAGVLMVIAFGLVALNTIPIQLTPDIRRPVIDIRTSWPGAAPVEVEREITNRLEQQLGGLEGVTEMTSRSQMGSSNIRLEFEPGYNLDKAMLLINNRLSGISGLPAEAREPRLSFRGDEDVPIAMFALRRSPGNTRDLETYGDLVEDVIADRLERVLGVAGTNIRGGSRGELRVVIDPERLAFHRLTVPEVLRALRGASASLSAGEVDEGKRRYVVRVESETNTVEAVRQIVLLREQDSETGRVGRVTVGDIAFVEAGYKPRQTHRRYMGEDAITIDTVRESGANVIRTMQGLREAVHELNTIVLPSYGLYMTQVFDETVYINAAISLVTQNIWMGGSLAALILILFLRSWRPTLIVAVAIPVSVIGAFVAMALLGRSLNVISLAGIAFAIGMVVDAAIVVLENIYRHRERGKSPFEAALIGAKQVWPAVFASALTTVVVFAPVLVLQLEVGQLFRDIAVALSVAVVLSLIVAVTVVPALARSLLTTVRTDGALPFRLPLIDPLARGVSRGILLLTRVVIRSKLAAIAMVAILVGGAGIFTSVALPPLDFLPDGNRNFVWGQITPPPGYNLETMRVVAENIETAVAPYRVDLQPPGHVPAPGDPPLIDHFFFVAGANFAAIGAASVDPMRASELEAILEAPVAREPGVQAAIRQSSIFSRGIGGARNIRLDIFGPDLEQNLAVARMLNERIATVLPRREGHRVRPRPGLELGVPEIRIEPDLLRLADAGLTATELAQTIDAFNDGMRIAEITVRGRRIDLTLTGPLDLVGTTQDISNLPIVTSDGRIVPASSLADISITSGPSAIWHLERQRYVQLDIRPARLIPLETTIEKLEREIIAPARAEGLPEGVQIRLSGAAGALQETWSHLQMDMLVAVLIVFLVLAVILESFLYPLIIMLSVPLATAGGVLGLWILNTLVLPQTDRQPLDMLTMLGFIILIGTVVNNAILLVTYTLSNIREQGLDPEAAILDATGSRIRPIFMSTLTTVFGMLPLMLMPGAGSELYRGLGAVVIGGLSLSALLTLLIIPPLLSLLSWKLARESRPVEAAPARAGGWKPAE